MFSYSQVVGFELKAITLKAILSIIQENKNLNKKSSNIIIHQSDGTESSLRSSNLSLSTNKQNNHLTNTQSKQHTSISSSSHIVTNIITILRWNGSVATKTSPIVAKTSMLWSDIDIYLKVDKFNLDENLLQIEIWDIKPNGDNGVNYGVLSLTGTELLKYINSFSTIQSTSSQVSSSSSSSSSSSTSLSSWLSINDKVEQCVLQTLNIKLEMLVITAEMMSSKHIREEFNQGIKLKGTKGSSNANITMDTLERCEINLICARDLFNVESNTFVIIYFNSEEIGRSSVVYNTSNPSWYDEIFEVMVPTSSSIEGCILQIDIYHLETDTSREFLIGHVKITGKMLANFLLNSKIKYQWFDLLDIDSNSQQGQLWPIHGELKLSGRPLHVNIHGDEDDAIEMPMIDLHLLSFYNINMNLLNSINNMNLLSTKFYVYADIFFNNRKIYKTKELMINGNDLNIKEHVTFRLSNSFSLFQSVLRLELYYIDNDTNLNSFDRKDGTLLATLQITGSTLSKFIGEKGMITKLFPMQLMLDNTNISSDINMISSYPEVELRGGRIGEKDIYEEQETELWFDVLAATNLPCRFLKTNIEERRNDYRPNVICEVSWNKLKIGKSSVKYSTITPIWDKLRFHLKVPIIQSVKHSGGSVLQFCKLRVDIYDQIDKNNKRLIGYHSFKSKDLIYLFENCVKQAQVKWFTIKTDIESITNASNGVFDDNNDDGDDDDDDDSSSSSSYESVSKLKVRGGYMGVENEVNSTVNDYIVQIKSAHKLSNTDIFGGADAYVIIYWCGDEVGRTQVIAKSVDPIFSHEYFVLHDHKKPLSANANAVRSLSLQVWSKLDNTKSVVFLGCVIIENEDLDLFLNPKSKNTQDNNQHEYLLKSNAEFTEEENQLVKGSIIVTSRLLIDFPINTVTRQEAILWIVSANNLHNSNSFGLSSDVYFKVYRKYDLDSAEDHEIYQSKVVTQSLDPVFTDELVTVIIPCLTEWIDFTLRIELWDNYNVLLGTLILADKEIQAILQRSDEEKILDHLSYPLISKFNDDIPPVIIVAGGLKKNFQSSWKDMKVAEVDRLALLVKIEMEEEIMNHIHVENAEITIISLTLITESSKKYNKIKSTKYCAISWNGVILGKTDVNEAVWKEQSFQISIQKTTPFQSCNLTINIYDNTKRNKADASDALLGTLSITKEEELNKLFDPSVDELTFPMKLKYSKNSEDYVLRINGIIPRVQQSYDLLHNDDVNDDRDLKTGDEDSKELTEQHIELKVIRASGLAQVNSIGRSTDAFAVIYWNDFNEPIGKTEVVPNSLNPIFDFEKFDITKKKGLKLNKCQLRVCLYNKNLLSAPTFLGEILISNDDLIEFITTEEVEVSREFQLKKSIIEKSKQNYVQGTLELSCTLLPDFNALPIFNFDIPMSNDLLEVEIMVLSAFNLAINNTKVTGDVYGRVEWGYSQLGSISMINHTLHTIWYDNQCFKIRVPKQWMQSAFLNDMVITIEDEMMVPQQYHHVLKYMMVTINMYTTTRNGKELLLGSIEINHEQLKAYISTSFHHIEWYNLIQSTKCKAQEQSNSIQGEIQVLISYVLPQSMINSNRKYAMDTRNQIIDISICSANLSYSMKQKLQSNKNNDADDDDIETYVYCRWNGRIVGKTYDESNAINPRWEDVNLHIKIPPYNPIEKSLLEFEVWQKSSKNSDNKSNAFFIGVVEINNENLKVLIETKELKSVHYSVQIPSDVRTHHLLLNSIQNLISFQKSNNNSNSNSNNSSTIELGELELKCGSINKNVIEDSDEIIPFEIEIFAAKDIYIMDKVMNTSDPFVICKWNRREVGRTKCITKSINPVWDNEKFLVPIDPDSDLTGCVLQVEVWNQRMNKKGDFLGCLYYTGQKLQEVFDDLQISGRTWFPLEKSPIIPDDQQINVKGQIEITIQPKQDRLNGGEINRNISSSLQSIVKWMQIRDRRAGMIAMYLLLYNVDTQILLYQIIMMISFVCYTV